MESEERNEVGYSCHMEQVLERVRKLGLLKYLVIEEASRAGPAAIPEYLEVIKKTETELEELFTPIVEEALRGANSKERKAVCTYWARRIFEDLQDPRGYTHYLTYELLTMERDPVIGATKEIRKRTQLSLLLSAAAAKIFLRQAGRTA